MSAIDDLRAWARLRIQIETELDRLAVEALEEGANRSAVALALGISRASLYRRFELRDRAAEVVGGDGSVRSRRKAASAVVERPHPDHGLSA
jgi:transposase-like protein